MNESGATQPVAQTSDSVSKPSNSLGSVERRVARLRFDIAAWRLLWGLEFYLAAALAVLSAVAFADQLARLDQETLRAFAFCWWAVGGVALLVLAWRVWKQTPQRGALALQLEARDRSYAGHLLTAVESLECPDDVPKAVAEVSSDRAWEVLRKASFRAVCPVLSWRSAHVSLMGALAVLFMGLGLFGFNYGRSLLDALFPGPSAFVVAASLRFIDVRPGDAEVDEGESLAIEVVCDGTVNGPLAVQVRGKRGARPVENALAARTDGEWSGLLKDLRKPCEYRVVAYGNSSAARRGAPALASQWFDIRLRPSQSLREVAVLVEPPAHTGAAPYWLKDPDLVEAPEDSQITVLMKAVPASGLSNGYIEVPGGLRKELERLADQQSVAQYRLRFLAERSGVLKIDLQSRRQERSGIQSLLPVSLARDLPPEVDVRIPDGAVANKEGLPVDVTARDEYGLGAARLVVRRLREGLEQSAEAKGETKFEIPLPAGTRKLRERWYIPPEAMTGWLALGFEYRLEALDNAPDGHLSKSAWARYEPLKRSQASAEREGLFDRPAKRRPRQLARSNALSSLPDPTPDQLAQLKGLGSGVEQPRQLRRPQAERLNDRSRRGNASGQSSPQKGKAKAQPKPKNGSRYDLPQDRPKEKKPKPEEGQGEAAGQRQERQGQGEPEGGEPHDGQIRQEEKPPAGKREGQGEGDPRDGTRTEDGGEQEDPGGAVGAPETQRGSGPGGRDKRDGGSKTGREPGAGKGKMAPPDLETLARLKGLSREEAEAYARKHGISMPQSGFGTRSGQRPGAGEAGRRHRMGDLRVKEPARSKTKVGETESRGDGPGVLRLSWDEIDPRYRPGVEGYFRRWHEWNQK